MTDAVAGVRWLELLSGNCSPADVQQLRARGLHGVREEPARRELERAADLAETLRARLADRERDARELRVLNDLARRLASMRDSRDLLAEVAAHSRHLLGVDVAYLMLPTGGSGNQGGGAGLPDLRIEIVDGSLGTALHGVVLHQGEGIGGEVMRTGRPLWSEVYLSDPRLTRVSSVDAVAAAEHLGGILGVPLRAGGETVGVLCAADRRPRRFSEHEVELLANLAAHAAVALRNAQLFEANQRAVAELRATNLELERTAASRRRAADLRERLTADVVHGAGLPDVARVLSHTVGVPVQILDAVGARRDGQALHDDVDVVALAGGPPSQWAVPADRRLRLGDRQAVVVPVQLRDEFAGCLVALGDEPPDAETVRLLELGAVTAALVVAIERTASEAQLRSRGELLGALLSSHSEPGELQRRAAAMRVDLDDVRSVVVLDGPAPDVQARVAAGHRLAAAVGGWAAEYAGRFIVLSGAPPRSARDRVASGFEIPDGTVVAIADGEGGVHGLRTGYDQARQTAALLQALGRTGVVVTADETGPYRSLFSHAGRDDLAAFVDSTVGGVLAYDRDRRRDLTATLQAYLTNSQQHTRTCEVLHIHPNTLYQRLERLDQLLGPGWREPGRALELQLALHLRSLADAIGSPG